jgi:hypothetical protein
MTEDMAGKAYRLRKTCRLCNAAQLIKVVELPLTVPGEHLKSSIEEADPEAIPIDFYQCERCGHVQIIHIPPLENLFNKDYTFMPGRNPDLIAHFKRTIDYFADNFANHVSFAFELGSNDGVFLDELRKKTGCRVLGMDPALAPAKVAEERGVETLLEFFDATQAARVVEDYGQPDLVVANNVFAHNDDLRDMISGIASMLKPGGYFMFEASWLKAVVEKCLIGTIIHEHLSVHSLTSLAPCLASFGLQLVGARCVDDIQGGAIVGIACKTDDTGCPDVIQSLMKEERDAQVTTTAGLKSFNDRLAEKVARLNDDLQTCIGDASVIGYGAARSAPFIIDVLGMAERISCVIDDNPVKKHKFMPITNIPVVGSDEVRVEEGEQAFLILGWAQTERIADKLRKQYRHGYLITVYPDFEVIRFDEGAD